MTETRDEIEEREAEEAEGADRPAEMRRPDEEPDEPEDGAGEPVQASKPTPAQLGGMSERQLTDLVEAGVMTPDEIEAGLQRFRKDQEAILDKLAREGERHRTRLAEILQEDILTCVPCELCRADLAGWIDSSQPIPEEVKARVRIQIGDREPRKLLQDPHAVRCATCDGETVVLTGAKDGANVTLPCVDCGGKGWIPTDAKRGGAAVAPAPAPALAGNGEPVQAGSPDLSSVPPEVLRDFVVIPKVRPG